MGFLRTITLYHDHWHQNEIRKNPEQFIRDLTEAMDRADINNVADRLCSGIKVQTSRHADDHTVFVHRGNTVVDLNHRAFRALPEEIQRDYVKTAQSIVSWVKSQLPKRAKKVKP